MTNQNPNNQTKYDLEERTRRFGLDIIRFCKTIPQDVISRPIISQLTRSGTSIGANYCEANEAVSKKDFYYRIGICKKEAKETMYWLKIIEDLSENNDGIKKLWQESHEFVLIFSSILNK